MSWEWESLLALLTSDCLSFLSNIEEEEVEEEEEEYISQ